jgi:hypothetical protein
VVGEAPGQGVGPVPKCLWPFPVGSVAATLRSEVPLQDQDRADSQGMWVADVYGEDGQKRPEVIIGDTYEEVLYYIENLDEPAWHYDVYSPDGSLAFSGEWHMDPAEARLIGDEDPEATADIHGYLDTDLASILLELGQGIHKGLAGKAPSVVTVIGMSPPEAGNLADLAIQNFAVGEDDSTTTPEDAALQMMTSALVHMASQDPHERQRVLRFLTPAFKQIRDLTYEAEA